MKNKIPEYVDCESCGKRLYHNKRHCPLFTKRTLWNECVCLIHSCYDKKEIVKIFKAEKKKKPKEKYTEDLCTIKKDIE